MHGMDNYIRYLHWWNADGAELGTLSYIDIWLEIRNAEYCKGTLGTIHRKLAIISIERISRSRKQTSYDRPVLSPWKL